MIIDRIVYIILVMFNGLISLFPVADVANIAQITTNVSTFRSLSASASWLFPVGTFFILLGIIFTIEASNLLFKLIRYIASHLSLGFIK